MLQRLPPKEKNFAETWRGARVHEENSFGPTTRRGDLDSAHAVLYNAHKDSQLDTIFEKFLAEFTRKSQNLGFGQERKERQQTHDKITQTTSNNVHIYVSVTPIQQQQFKSELPEGNTSTSPRTNEECSLQKGSVFGKIQKGSPTKKSYHFEPHATARRRHSTADGRKGTEPR